MEIAMPRPIAYRTAKYPHALCMKPSNAPIRRSFPSIAPHAGAAKHAPISLSWGAARRPSRQGAGQGVGVARLPMRLKVGSYCGWDGVGGVAGFLVQDRAQQIRCATLCRGGLSVSCRIMRVTAHYRIYHRTDRRRYKHPGWGHSSYHPSSSKRIEPWFGCFRTDRPKAPRFRPSHEEQCTSS